MLNLQIVEHRLTTDRGRLRVVVEDALYRDFNTLPACAFVVGEPVDGCLVRVHSRCLYGDVMGSHECDCAAQLRTALDRIWDEGCGVVVYLDQEGRGSGLFAKALACSMQESEGLDTFTVYDRHGWPEDHRSYDAAARLLTHLGLGSVRLLTNNLDKVAGLDAQGIEVKRVPLVCDHAPEAVPYIESKRARGHLFDRVAQMPIPA